MAKTKQTSERVDVLIGGAGFAGLALAIALRQGLGETFAVTVADPALGRSHAGDARASAIAAAARRLFETIGVWDKVAAGAQPILDMVVTDSKLQDVMRPTYLTFAGEVQPGEPFAHMIENGPLVEALLDRARADGVELRACAVVGFDPHPAPPPFRGREHSLHSLPPPERGRNEVGVPDRIEVTLSD